MKVEAQINNRYRTYDVVNMAVWTGPKGLTETIAIKPLVQALDSRVPIRVRAAVRRGLREGMDVTTTSQLIQHINSERSM